MGGSGSCLGVGIQSSGGTYQLAGRGVLGQDNTGERSVAEGPQQSVPGAHLRDAEACTSRYNCVIARLQGAHALMQCATVVLGFSQAIGLHRSVMRIEFTHRPRSLSPVSSLHKIYPGFIGCRSDLAGVMC